MFSKKTTIFIMFLFIIFGIKIVETRKIEGTRGSPALYLGDFSYFIGGFFIFFGIFIILTLLQDKR